MILAHLGEIFLLFSFVGSVIYLFKQKNYLFWITFVSLLLSIFLLLWFHLSSSFQILNVYLHSHTAKPFIYKMTALWGSHEGSMLLWCFFLCFYWGVSVYSNPLKVLKTPAIIMALIVSCFVGFTMVFSSPFAYLLTAPTEGQDLNPLLQDYSFTIHPPILYTGLSAFSLSFVIAISQLIKGIPLSQTFPKEVVSILRTVNAWGWTVTALGIFLGSFWAYYELGWGGYWYWDPVENVAFIPWLASTALLHNTLKNTISHSQSSIFFFSVSSFLLVLLGLFLVRSGLLVSVHSFANAPDRGFALLGIFIIFSIFTIFTYLNNKIRTKDDNHTSIKGLLSSLILAQNLLLFVIMVSILFATIFPLLCSFYKIEIFIGPAYYQRTVIPFIIIMMVIMAVGPFIKQKMPQADFNSLITRSLYALILSALICVLAFYKGLHNFLILMGIFASAWVIFHSLFYLRTKKSNSYKMPVFFAHMAVGVMGLSISLGAYLGQEEDFTIYKGQRIELGHKSITFTDSVSEKFSNYHTQKAFFYLPNVGKYLTPETRYYWTQRAIHQETSFIHSTLHHYYAVIHDWNKDGSVAARIYYKPFINLLWIGALMLIFSGGLTFLNHLKKFLIFIPFIFSISFGFCQEKSRLYQELSNSIICPVCAGQTIHDSQSDLASSMRQELKSLVDQGLSKDQIFSHFENKYGHKVLSTPPTEGVYMILWTFPFIIFGIIFILFMLKKPRR